jgi:peptidoglycan/xylan/chitin deacetylase (PgdA/CDA1 family)
MIVIIPRPAARAALLLAAATLVAACGSPAARPTATAVSTTPAATATASAPVATPVVIASSTPLPPATQTPAVTPVGPATVISRGDASHRIVALTFDAGSDAGYTAEILDVLQQEHVRASFGVTGLWAEQNRDLLNAIAAQGHEFINHTYHHDSFTGLSTGAAPLTSEQRALELSRTEVTVFHLTGRSTRPYFRPPYGDIDASVAMDAAAAGYSKIILWTVDSSGWNGASPDAIVERCLSQAVPGAIYVMHVGSASQDAAALPRVIDGLRVQGYDFATISELLAPTAAPSSR